MYLKAPKKMSDCYAAAVNESGDKTRVDFNDCVALDIDDNWIRFLVHNCDDSKLEMVSDLDVAAFNAVPTWRDEHGVNVNPETLVGPLTRFKDNSVFLKVRCPRSEHNIVTGDVRDITICVRDIKCHQNSVTVNWRVEDWGEAKSTYIFENTEDPVEEAEEETVDDVEDQVECETENLIEDEIEHDENDNQTSEITVESNDHSENPTISNLKQTIEGIEKTLNEVKQLVLTIG